jgi:hypothetical protein
VAVTLAKTHDHAEYDPTVLTALGTLVADPASGVTPFALDYFSSLGAQWRASGYRPDPDATDAALARLWGPEAATREAAALAEITHRLPAAQAKRGSRYLAETGLCDYVPLLEFLDERAQARRKAGG